MFFAVVILWFFVEKGSPLCLWSELGATEGGSLVKTTPLPASILLYAMLIKKQGMFAAATKKAPVNTTPLCSGTVGCAELFNRPWGDIGKGAIEFIILQVAALLVVPADRFLHILG